jgi:DNA-binding transcriptional LysR family regulator
MVNLEWYRSFVATYQTGTVTAAAAQRFLTQPALSQHIAALEQALKTTLFERTARRMVPTDAAQKLYPKVIASIERLEAIEHTPLAEAGLPWLRLGAPNTYFYEQVLNPSLFARLDKLRLDVVVGETPALIEKLKANELDLVIATQKISQPRLHYVQLPHEHFMLVLPKAMQPDITGHMGLAQMEAWLSQQAWISYSAQMPIIRRYWQTVFNKRPDFEPQMIVPDLHAILRGIELGLGISILPDYMLRGENTNTQVHTPWQAPVEVSNALYLVCQQERAKEPMISLALKSVKEVLENHN